MNLYMIILLIDLKYNMLGCVSNKQTAAAYSLTPSLFPSSTITIITMITMIMIHNKQG